MADRPRFGPAGVPRDFKELKRPVEEFPLYLHEESLDAFEYQAVRWGPKPQMRREKAEELGVNAKKSDVWLTLHGSYFINLCGEGDALEASKNRLMACVTAAQWMGAHTTVFHSGAYGKESPETALQRCVKAMRDAVERMKNLGVTRVRLGPETAGKDGQLGTLDEILSLCESVELTEPVIDWAHLHARGKGAIKTREDYAKVLDEIERRLGTEAVKNLHVHFTPVEFTDRGERRHYPMNETQYGPSFKPLAQLIAQLGLRPVIISETPLLDQDSKKMRDTLNQILKQTP